mgnify:CR=1 FL=1
MFWLILYWEGESLVGLCIDVDDILILLISGE